MSTRGGLARGGQRMRVMRARVLERDGPICGRCTRAIDLSLPGLHPDGLTLGHIIASSRGGSDDVANLRPEHRSCNLAASDRLAPPRAIIVEPIPIGSVIGGLIGLSLWVLGAVR